LLPDEAAVHSKTRAGKVLERETFAVASLIAKMNIINGRQS
jgi:hypothetical protein